MNTLISLYLGGLGGWLVSLLIVPPSTNKKIYVSDMILVVVAGIFWPITGTALLLDVLFNTCIKIKNYRRNKRQRRWSMKRVMRKLRCVLFHRRFRREKMVTTTEEFLNRAWAGECSYCGNRWGAPRLAVDKHQRSKMLDPWDEIPEGYRWFD